MKQSTISLVQRLSVRRWHEVSRRPRIDPAVWLTVDWSQEQIVGRGIARVSIERIYQHIATDRAQGGDLWRHRRRRRCRRRIGTLRLR